MKVAPLFDVDVDFFSKVEEKVSPIVFPAKQKKE